MTTAAGVTCTALAFAVCLVLAGCGSSDNPNARPSAPPDYIQKQADASAHAALPTKPSPAAAASASNAATAAHPLQAAQQAEKSALAQNCAWSVSEDALHKAEALAKQGKADESETAARRALSLIQASLFQCKQQKTAWKNAVVQ